MKTKFLIILMICLAVVLSVIFFAFIFGEPNNKNNIPTLENNILTPEPKPIEKPKPNENLEVYKSELFIQADWGSGNGEVGLHNPSDQGIEDAGPNYGPQSFDVAENGHLFLLDSVNERVIEYGADGNYLKDFPIACGGTGDIKVSPCQKYLYIFSWRCGGVYKYDLIGSLLESYPVLPKMQKSPGLCTGGLDFDRNGNIMLELRVDEIADECRFYQIGENGDEWKENNFEGYISKDGEEFYKIKGVDWQLRIFQIFNKENLFKKEFSVELPKKAYVYYEGNDNRENIYLNVAFEHYISTEERWYFDKFVWRYSKEGRLLSRIDILEPLREIHKISDNKFLPDYTYAESPMKNIRIISEGDIYYMFTFKDTGLKIFKYSKNEPLTTMGYIKKIYEENGKRYLDIDYVQWLIHEEALKAGIEDGVCEEGSTYCFPNGYYIRNQNPKIRTFEISENVEIIMCSYGSGECYIEWDEYIDYETFKNLFDKNISQCSHFIECPCPFHVTFQNNKIITIEEQYIP